jgi:tRNA(adenine34) deaminase
MKRLLLTLALLHVLFQFSLAGGEKKQSLPPDIVEIEKGILAYVPDARYVDDPFVLVAVKESLAAFKEGNGGVGACLVHEGTGKIVERGRNRQFRPHFRSDLHAEMDLLTRFEERVKAPRLDDLTVPQAHQRKIEGLVLYTSVEPCPMCLSRIINIGLKKTYYAAPDPSGGMALKIQNLPAFWQELAAGRIYEPARCSPELVALAKALFRPIKRK